MFLEQLVHGHNSRGCHIALFIRQVFAELRKVVTPTRQELIKYTGVVLGFVVVMMALVYGLDLLFVWVTTIVFGVPA